MKSITSLASSITSAIALFIIFRLSNQIVSQYAMGCWSLLQGIFFVARIVDSGAGTNVTRFTARHIQTHSKVSIKSILVSSLLIASFPAVLVALLLYFPATIYVGETFGDQLQAPEIQVLAVQCVLLTLTNSISVTILSTLEGVGNLNSKNIITIISNIAGCVTASPLMNAYGIAGIGLSYNLMASIQILLGLVMLVVSSNRHQHDSELGIKVVIKEMWTENYKLSAASVVRLSFEPVTKLLLSRVATLDVIASFELALRMATQARILIQSALQPMLVFGSRRISNNAISTDRTFTSIQSVAFYGIFLLAECQVAAGPIVSYLGFNRIDSVFLLFFTILIWGNCVNSCGLVGYIYQLSTGNLGKIVKMQFHMAIVNLLGGVAAAVLSASPYLIVAAYSAAFAFGGVKCTQFLTYHSDSEGQLRWTYPTLSLLVFSVLSYLFIMFFEANFTVVFCVSLIAASLASVRLMVFIVGNYKSIEVGALR